MQSNSLTSTRKKTNRQEVASNNWNKPYAWGLAVESGTVGIWQITVSDTNGIRKTNEGFALSETFTFYPV